MSDETKVSDDGAMPAHSREYNIKMVNEFLGAQGISLDELKTFQASQAEVTESPPLTPSEITGTSGIVSDTPEGLTSRVLALETSLDDLRRRCINIDQATGSGQF